MTNAELIAKIKAEIERRISFHNKAINSCTGLNNISLTHAAGLKEGEELLSFLSDLEKSLPAKVVDNKSLEMEAVSYCFDNGLNISPRVANDFAQHFYDLGCHRTAEKYDEIEYNRQRASGSSEIPNDLEEAAEEYAKEHSFHPCDYDVTPYDSFIAGAEWDREQMMDGAVDGTMHEQPDGTTFLDCQSSFPAGMFNHEEKVHIIVVKEDEK